ncbi:heme-binding domain-containing protein [bacterium]|nr:heme-binding domain-containing protein [bacterium]
MKKIILIVTSLIIFILITRFIEIKTPPLTETKPALRCTTDSNANGLKCATLEAINKEYQEKVLPMAKEKCLMCHGHVEKMPLYSVIPPASFLVNHDIDEAKEKYNMTFDFPFSGKEGHDFVESLDELIDVIDEGEMPPAIYLAMHLKSFVSASEKQAIMEWIKHSKALLAQEGITKSEAGDGSDEDRD